MGIYLAYFIGGQYTVLKTPLEHGAAKVGFCIVFNSLIFPTIKGIFGGINVYKLDEKERYTKNKITNTRHRRTSMTSQINVGLIGYGFSAKTFHLPFLQALGPYHVRKIYTSQTAQPTHDPSIQLTSRLEDLWEDPELDLIVITSPNALHGEHAFNVLSRHKHVVVEKPFVLDIPEGKRLIELAQHHQKILTVFHNRRWDADFLTLQKLIKKGTLGNISYVESRYDRFRPEVKKRWKEDDVPGSGILWDLGAHLIDQVLLLFGSPAQIFADCTQHRPLAKTTDYFKLLFSYPSGLRVVLGGSNLSLAPGPKFVVHGTKGSFVKSGLDVQEAHLMKDGFNTIYKK